MKLSELVRQVIRLGDASRAYWDRELPKHHPHYPVIRAGEDSSASIARGRTDTGAAEEAAGRSALRPPSPHVRRPRRFQH